MASSKPQRKKLQRKEWTKVDIARLRQHAKAKTPVSKMAKEFRRTQGAIRQKAFTLDLSIGHRGA